jgi:hypothetical protein
MSRGRATIDLFEPRDEDDPRSTLKEVAMVRRVLAGLGLAALSSVVVPIFTSAPAVAAPPVAIQQCMNGGWQTLTGASGQPFKNQGQCISYQIHHPVSLADLAGSFTGTTSDTFPGNCSVVEMMFDATYAGSASVGTVSFHLDGCLSFIKITPPILYTYIGTGTFLTNVGSISGTVSGTLTGSPPAPADIELSLTVSSGTGAFITATGSLHISMQWTGCCSTVVTGGSVTVP